MTHTRLETMHSWMQKALTLGVLMLAASFCFAEEYKTTLTLKVGEWVYAYDYNGNDIRTASPYRSLNDECLFIVTKIAKAPGYLPGTFEVQIAYYPYSRDDADFFPVTYIVKAGQVIEYTHEEGTERMTIKSISDNEMTINLLVTNRPL